jgi:signal transduction histidine kinase
MLTAWALWLVRADRREQDSIGRHLGFASAAFVAYGIVAGAIVSPGSVFPASYPSSETVLSATRMPVEILRMGCAACISMFLSEALVIQAARERDELERRREEFISIVAHDLRSPIAVIDMGAELLERHIGGIEGIDPQRTNRFLQNIKTSARGLERMVRDLLDASRIETSTVALELREVELRALIGGIVDRAGETTRGHRVIAVLPESLPMVRADPLRLEQILVNLLSNAAKYSEPDAEITVETIVRDDEVEIAVTNPGTGLSQQEIGKVFSRFYRSAQHVRRADGLGLGLYIVKGLVQAQGGRVWVDSEVGRYATFRFTVPRSSVRPEVATPTVPAS